MEGDNTLEDKEGQESDGFATPINQWHKKNLSLYKPIRGVTDTNLKKAVKFTPNDQDGC